MAAGHAGAVPITRTFEVSATNFYRVWGPTIPVDPVKLSATVTFDPSIADYSTKTAGLHLISSNVATDYPFSFSYYQSVDVLFFGGTNGGAEGLYTDTTDYFIDILNPASANPTVWWVSYTTGPAGGWYDTHTGTVTWFDGAPSSAPEPGAWALMLVGFAGVGLSLRGAVRRRGALAA